MVEYGIDLDARPVAKQLQKIGRDMPQINRGILGLLAEQVITDSQSKYLRGRPGLKRQTGKLAQSLTHKVGNQWVDIGTNLIYAEIHEKGGTIKPKNGKYLRFQIDGKWIMARSVTIPARPYLGPPIKDLFASGKAELIADRELQRQFDRRD